MEDGYPRGTPKEKLFKGTMGWPEEEKLGYPYPSGFTKQNLFIKVFNKDIGMLYPREKLFSKLFLSQQRYRGV